MSLNPLNPFHVNEVIIDDMDNGIFSRKIHIRVKQRTTRSYTTYIEGLNERLDLKKLLSVIKKTFNCGGNIDVLPDGTQVIKLTGDQRDKIKQFLIEKSITDADDIILHGI